MSSSLDTALRMGRELREQRRKRRMTLDQVALEVGVSASTLSRWERRGTSDEGKRTMSSRLPENLDVKTFELLSKWLHPAGENPDY